MRAFLVVLPVALVLAALPCLASGPGKADLAYELDFNPETDVSQVVEGQTRFITVRFGLKQRREVVGDEWKKYKVRITENGVTLKDVSMPEPVAATKQDLLSLVLAIDVSGSMNTIEVSGDKPFRRIDQARAAAVTFLVGDKKDKTISGLPPSALCGLILFDHEMKKVIERTLKRDELIEAIMAQEPSGGTAYLDATWKSIDMQKEADPRAKKVVVVMTDGVDMNSEKTLQYVIDEARRRNVKVYTIGIGEPGHNTPVTTVLTLDKSGSMRDPDSDENKRDASRIVETEEQKKERSKIVALKKAAIRFITMMRPGAQTTLLEFNDKLQNPRPFSNNKALLTKDVEERISYETADGETAFLDAAYTAVASLIAALGQDGRGQFVRADPRKKVVVIRTGTGKDEQEQEYPVTKDTRYFGKDARLLIDGLKDAGWKAKANVWFRPSGFAKDRPLTELRLSPRDKRAVVVLTDGVDNSSRRRKEEVIALAKEAGIPIYMLGLGLKKELDEGTMREIAEATDGKYWLASNKAKLMELFEDLSIKLHDEGVDEKSLTRLAVETGGEYYPAKDAAKLKFILEKVTQSLMKPTRFAERFRSNFQAADGTLRTYGLKLLRGEEVVGGGEKKEVVRGVVVAEMNYLVYMGMLGLLGVLLALPPAMRRLGRNGGGK